MMKSRVSCQLSRRPNGDVTGKMIGEDGQILDTRYFGKFTEKEFKHLSKVIMQEMPTTVADIELVRN